MLSSHEPLHQPARRQVRERCAALPNTRSMKADFYTSDENLLIVIDMPGVSKEDVKITFQEGRLRIEGAAGAHGATCQRAFRLSDRYDTARTRATVERGVVRLEVPKHVNAKPVRIPVNAA